MVLVLKYLRKISDNNFGIILLELESLPAKWKTSEIIFGGDGLIFQLTNQMPPKPNSNASTYSFSDVTPSLHVEDTLSVTPWFR